jgi:hypothetical protein
MSVKVCVLVNVCAVCVCMCVCVCVCVVSTDGREDEGHSQAIHGGRLKHQLNRPSVLHRITDLWALKGGSRQRQQTKNGGRTGEGGSSHHRRGGPTL